MLTGLRTIGAVEREVAHRDHPRRHRPVHRREVGLEPGLHSIEPTPAARPRIMVSFVWGSWMPLDAFAKVDTTAEPTASVRHTMPAAFGL